MTRPIPTIEAHKDLVTATQDLLKGDGDVQLVLRLVEEQISAQLWPEANAFHAEVLGAKLAGDVNGLIPSGLYGPQMLEMKWKAGFTEHPATVYRLSIHGAYEFALCAMSIFKRDKDKVAAMYKVLSFLEKMYPMPNRGVFQLGDISRK
jgi:hypothetical protein